tara:strand:- start:18378 stop:18677 length:300 start_codon:yes stop_codon:yes gene_type:complete
MSIFFGWTVELGAQTNPHNPYVLAETLIGEFYDLDKICQKYSETGYSETFACGARYGVAIALYRIGWCFGESGQEYQFFEWDICGPISLSPAEMILVPY